MGASVTLWEATAPVKLPARHCPYTGLRYQVRIPATKEWYPTADSNKPCDLFSQSPPILYINYQNPISSCSKAPRGLAVLSQVTGIFTGITISPSPSLRQCPDRYAFRAGLNLPDKEFRYLRTVIVTAAVHRGFGSKLRSFPLTSPPNLPAPGRRQPLYFIFRFRRDLCFC